MLGILIKAAHPVILWMKGKPSAIEFWVDSNNGNCFVPPIINTEPNTTDTIPLLATGTNTLML